MIEIPTLTALVSLSSLLLASLTTGAMFGYWLTHHPAGLTPGVYILHHQNGIRTLNGRMPVLGIMTMLLIFVAAALARHDSSRCLLLSAAGVSFLAAGLITRFRNQVINSIVLQWSPDAPPANWAELRDSWWRWHRLRMVCGALGLCLAIVALERCAAL
jgi:hypothetical protein